MSAIFTIAKREWGRYFASPAAYALLTTWLLWAGGTFWLLCQAYAGQMVASGSETPLSVFYGGTVLFFLPLLVFAPLLTMRLVADEHASGTLEPLLTAGVSANAIIVGKYLAALAFWMVMWLPTLAYAWITHNFGSVDVGAVASSYLAIFGVGAYYMGVGLWMSTLAPNQIVAGVLTFLVLGALFAIGIAGLVLPDGLTKEICNYLSVWGQMSKFARGIVDSRFLVFDASLALFSVLAASVSLRMRRWA